MGPSYLAELHMRTVDLQCDTLQAGLVTWLLHLLIDYSTPKWLLTLALNVLCSALQCIELIFFSVDMHWTV